MKDIKEINTIEEALELREQLAQELQKCNQLIFEEDESINTVEFNNKYNKLKDDFNQIEEILLQNHYKEPAQTESILNNVSIWIWPYMIVLILLTIYPIFYLLDLEIIMAFLNIEKLTDMNDTNIKIVIYCAFAILPASLLLLNVAPNFFLKKKENKKIYLIMSCIFWASLLISTVITLIKVITMTTNVM